MNEKEISPSAVPGGSDAAWRLLDTSANPLKGEVYEPFAIEEHECERVGAGASPLLHLWRHDKAIVLGLRDRRLPSAADAMRVFREEGWSVAVRNSGGAAVPLTAGVLNVSIVQPNPPGTVRIHDDFARMAELISRAAALLSLEQADVKAGEITGAYCPGDYDLSINGIKFCGIAQRRRLGAYVVQAFVVVEGSGAHLAAQAARYYRSASGGADHPYTLDVRMQSTRSLQELIDPSVTIERFIDAVKRAAVGTAGFLERESTYRQYDQAKLKQIIEGLKARYDTD